MGEGGEHTWGPPLGERRPPFREYHFMQHTPSNIALTHRYLVMSTPTWPVFTPILIQDPDVGL